MCVYARITDHAGGVVLCKVCARTYAASFLNIGVRVFVTALAVVSPVPQINLYEYTVTRDLYLMSTLYFASMNCEFSRFSFGRC